MKDLELPIERLQALDHDFCFVHTEDNKQNNHKSDHPHT